MTLNLYTYKPLNNTLCNDDMLDKFNFHIQGKLESLQDDTKSKFACFLELKREQNSLLKKLNKDLLHHNNGNYYANHVLLDVLNMYKEYVEMFADEESAFDLEIVALCKDTVFVLFELFNNVNNIVVFVKSYANQHNILTKLLNELKMKHLVTIIKTVDV
ncbi:p18 [Cnaphalocrocis medinalis granulovirus]|uniref:p18 n=1 Tax=Cnaphalocrocis medinalis granulovirus TaxID=1750712 RepID=A0A109P616_9BBAC|nr:p18 [Cnaphalocrocis medinalis granulovirus]ALN42014.1 p18 [Cnaphalocrocis medinalis granulovirus]AMF83826.1 p18 [Cnaphalocrocis medinalis granulovirus]WPN08704.1 p18 [Cnaphalocrocis medinalis granulovirus]